MMYRRVDKPKKMTKRSRLNRKMTIERIFSPGNWLWARIVQTRVA